MNNTERDIVYILWEDKRAPMPRTGLEANSVDLGFVWNTKMNGYLSVPKGNITELSTGIKIYTDKYDFFLLPRSSSSLLINSAPVEDEINPIPMKMYNDEYLQLANTVGYIDHNYRGPVIARFLTVQTGLDSTRYYLQLIPRTGNPMFKVVASIDDIPVHLHETVRGDGRFGSSDKK